MNIKHIKIAPIIDTQDGLSMIEACVTKKGKRFKGYFYIDTGSSISIIDINLALYSGETTAFSALGANENNSYRTIVDFKIGVNSYKMNFHAVKKELLPKEKGKIVIGILGMDFLKNNLCIIDFKHNALYKCTYKVDPKDSMRIEYDESGIPTITINGGNGPQPCLIDTGSDPNIMSQAALANGNFTFSLTNKIDTLYGLGYKIKSTSAVVCFFSEEIGDTHFEEEFQIPMEEANAMLNIGKSKNVEIILGSSFMKRKKWILDFMNNIIYKNMSTS